jgi:RNA polymerase sigma factor (sigma-70 family)
MDAIVRGIQDQVHRLALRMMGDLSAAEDATQEILLKVVNKLSTFKGDSRFETWVYRIAMNHLLTARSVLLRDPGLSFEMFESDLLQGLVDPQDSVEDAVLVNELRLKCTMAMLLCLDRDHRAAYVLGEVLEMDHQGASAILDVTPANFRQRLSRARRDVQAFTARACGIGNSAGLCQCSRRVPAALAEGRIGQQEGTLNGAPSYAEILEEAQRVEADLRVAKLQRATGPLNANPDIAQLVLKRVGIQAS